MIIRSDNGGEFTGKNARYFTSMGIEMQTTVPYTSEQNGKVERVFQTIVGTMRSIQEDSGLPWEYWPHFAHYATFIHNATTITKVGDTERTAYE